MHEFRRLSANLAVTAVAILLLAAGCAAKRGGPPLTEEQRQLNVDSFDVVWTTIRDEHFDPDLGGVDWDGAREELRPQVAEASSMSEARAIMEELLGRLGHTHVGIIPGAVRNAAGQSSGTADQSGVTGMDLRVVDGHALVTAVWEGFPAEAAGVRMGWEVVKIGDEKIPPLLEKVHDEYSGRVDEPIVLAFAVMDRLSGPRGETIPVVFLDGEDRRRKTDLPLVENRGELFQVGLLPPTRVWIETRLIEPGVGYVAFSNFAHPTHVMQVYNSAMESFLDADGVVIDLRGNTGGLGAMVSWMAGWLISEKDQSLGTMYMKETVLRFVVFPRPRTFDGPVAMLVDGVSASASELFASGMQELGRARIFGSRTAGASLPAQTLSLPNGDGLIYPNSKHVTESGRMIEGEGVFPDVTVEPAREELLQGRDLVLETALDWIRNQMTAAVTSELR